MTPAHACRDHGSRTDDERAVLGRDDHRRWQRLARLVSRQPRSAALGLLGAYRGGLADRDVVGVAAIAVERVAAPVLPAAGTADAMWSSGEMAQELPDGRVGPVPRTRRTKPRCQGQSRP